MKLVMIDVDGVLLNEDYRTTRDIRPLISDLRSAGIKMVPNSDTPIDRLKRIFSEKLGFEPDTVIGELGAVIEIDGQRFFPNQIRGIPQLVEELADIFSSSGAVVEIGDSATWIKEGKLFPPNSNLLILDGLREQTVAFYLKVTDETGLPRTDPAWSEGALRLVSQVKFPSGLKPLDYNPKYGIAIANAEGADKTSGFHSLGLRYGIFFMIGDSRFDIIKDNAVISCAVGNAVEELKAQASFVSDKPYTEGLEESLLWIADI